MNRNANDDSQNRIRPKRVDIEREFDRFVPGFRGGARIDELYLNLGQKGENADYYFQADNIILELKTLTKDQAEPLSLPQRIVELLVREGYSGSDILSGRAGLGDLPPNVRNKIMTKMGNALRNAFKKANRQVASTKRLLDLHKASGIVLIANDGDYGLNPPQAMRFLAGEALRFLAATQTQSCTPLQMFSMVTALILRVSIGFRHMQKARNILATSSTPSVNSGSSICRQPLGNRLKSPKQPV